MPSPSLHQRIIARLAQAEVEELDPWLRDDLRIARLTVCYAANGEAVLCSPHVLASYMVLGVHPEKVWPAIQARRDALESLYGPVCLEVSGAPSVPKKPAQSVPLWTEKNERRESLVNSRADETLLRDNTISVPMATASTARSIAALYPNPDAASSAKTRQFSLAEIKYIVGYSGAPDSICDLTLSALRARGEWPNQDGPATSVLSVAIMGMMLEGVCCRSTVQRRIKRAVRLGFWRRLRDANSWTDCPKCGTKRSVGKCGKCNYQGRSRDAKGNWTGEFMRVPAYEFDIQKFRSAQRCREIRHFDARTYAEYKEAAKRGEHPNVTEMPRKPAQPAPERDPDPPTKAAPVKQPAAEERKPLAITRDVRIAVAGCYSNARKQGKSEDAAIAEVCETYSSERFVLAPAEVRLQLKIWQGKHGSLDPPPTRQPFIEKCGTCQTELVQNFGPGPRLKCPKCFKPSSP